MSGDDLVDVRLPRSVVEGMRKIAAGEPQSLVGFVEASEALVEHNPEPIKVGDWIAPGWHFETGPCLVVAAGLGRLHSDIALRHRDDDTISFVFVTGGDWERCGPHPDPVIRARILKAAGR